MRNAIIPFSLLLAACQAPAGDALVPDLAYQPVPEDARYQSTSQITVAPPYAIGEQCVDYQEAKRHQEELEAAKLAVEKTEAEQRGWRALEEYRVVQHRGDEFWWRDDFQVKRKLVDRVIDSDGNHWLAVEQSNGCYDFEGRFYVDAENRVFRVYTDLACANTVEVDGCGQFPGDGCGTEPDYAERRFVRVPEGARLIRTRGIFVPTATCYAVRPLEGIAYPP